MNARVVLDDCRTALNWVENAKDERDFRVAWVALVALLRAVGHVLHKVDGSASPALRRAIDVRWHEWQRNPDRFPLFWSFIEAERNAVLKTYEMGFQLGNVQLAVEEDGNEKLFELDHCLFKPLIDGPFEGEDGRDVAREAIS